MILDQFDQDVLSASGKAKDLIYEFYGSRISQNNAEKQIAGIRRHLRHKKKLDKIRGSEMEEIHVKADGSQTTKRLLWLSEEDKKSPTRILDLMGYDPMQWKLNWHKMKRAYWDVTIKNDAKEGVKHTNHAFMVEVSVSPIQDILTFDMVKETLEGIIVQKPEKIRYKDQCGLLLEIPIVDFHLGLLAWGEETGADYDLKIAESLYKNTIMDFISRVQQYGLKIERILFPIGQDFFNSDTTDNTTTKGTRLDSDTRWGKLFSTGVELLVWSVEQLRRVAPIDVFHIAGNHDKVLSYCATEVLRAYFRETEGVSVTVSPMPRKYYQFGKCLIGFAHGADEGRRIKDLMQVEAPKMWGETKFREMHLGHLHSESVEEQAGVIYRHIGTMKTTDAWEKDMGFVGAIHKSQAFLWDKEKGKQLTIDSLQTLDKQG
jgi:hypothetical protein